MPVQTLAHRLATRADLEMLRQLMDAAIGQLQKPFLDARQIESSRTIMGLDTQLIDDGTYFVVESGGEVAGCGGWSRRATLYGGTRRRGAVLRCWTRSGMRPGSAPCIRIPAMSARAWGG
ncbi:MAG TPA: hypothetical protein VF460_07215 [Burkholderiales bacterium]